MKSGASDPFSDDADDEGEQVPEEGDDEAQQARGEAQQERGGEAASGTAGEDGARGDDGESGGESPAFDRSQIPYTLRRDNVKDERPHVHQLFVQDATDDAARDVERGLEDILGTDVYRLDAREAIYRIGMRHPEEVADLLEEWGYNF